MTGITSEQVSQLAAPFAPEAVHWRAQTVNERGGKHFALALAYLDARDVQDRLDGVCSPENWQDAYVETIKGRIICTLSIRIGEEWIAKSDGAGDTDVEGEKGALSDAMKRAAVKWGIGRYLYSMPNVWVPCEVGNNGKFKKFTEDPWDHVRGAGFRPEAPAGPIDAAQYAMLTALLEASKADIKAFLKFYKTETVAALPASRFADAVSILTKKIKEAA